MRSDEGDRPEGSKAEPGAGAMAPTAQAAERRRGAVKRRIKAGEPDPEGWGKFCIHCGAKIQGAAKFCTVCGRPQ